ncbi:MAG TPA: peptide ligase PGM1-related protein [Acidimicrobiales bacterium]|nr:peptide ligase PGM1-related protein [Acidimicrobiales bacterium]
MPDVDVNGQDPVPPSWERGTMVVLPSLSFPVAELVKITGIDHYEERLLCTLLLLQRPDVRVVYLTSQPLDPAIVDYYLGFLDDPAEARTRLHLLAAGEVGPRPLTQKVLDRPEMLSQLRRLLPDDGSATLLPFNVTAGEWELATALGLPLDGPPVDRVPLGSKTGSRRVAHRAGIAVPAGEEALYSLVEVEAAIGRLGRRGRAARAVVKLNDGFSGQGNALVDLTGPAASLSVDSTTFCAAGESWSSFGAKIATEGAIVEEAIDSPLASPSVQLRIAPGGAVRIVSTHDQVLGGPGGQVYQGCRFPASESYRAAIGAAAVAVGDVLAEDGVVGPLGIDFLVTGQPGAFEIFLSEINLRMGGTTHPFWMARLATAGRYDAGRGQLVVRGRPRCYVATDNLKLPNLVGSSPASVVAAVETSGLAFDRATGSGATLHLLGALARHGKMGVTCIADDPEGAQARFAEVTALLARH